MILQEMAQNKISYIEYMRKLMACDCKDSFGALLDRCIGTCSKSEKISKYSEILQENRKLLANYMHKQENKPEPLFNNCLELSGH